MAKKYSRVHTRLHRRARTSPFCPKNEPSLSSRRYPYQRRSAVFVAAKTIETILRDGDHLLTNVCIEYEGKPTELDIVIVNRYGVFIFEVKNYNGILVGGENDYEWMKYKTTRAGNVYESTVKNPIKQVKRQIFILSRYLDWYGMKTWIKGYAILLLGNSPVQSEYILTSVDEVDRVIHTFDRRALVPDKVESITRLLSS